MHGQRALATKRQATARSRETKTAADPGRNDVVPARPERGRRDRIASEPLGIRVVLVVENRSAARLRRLRNRRNASERARFRQRERSAFAAGDRGPADQPRLWDHPTKDPLDRVPPDARLATCAIATGAGVVIVRLLSFVQRSSSFLRQLPGPSDSGRGRRGSREVARLRHRVASG